MELEETESKINFVPCLTWVKRGVAKAEPEKVQLTKDELVQIINDTRNKLHITEEAESSTSSANKSDVPMTVEEEYKLDDYDNDDETDTCLSQLGIQSIAELPTEAEENFSDDDSEKEDDIIKPSDNLILAGKVDGDASILEVYVYNESEGSLYCHHDLLLPAFPLCIEWLDHEPGHAPGNYCAIGSMSPIIDIWDLDVVNCLEPAYNLGKKASVKKNQEAVGHSDAVLDLSWNPNYHHILASGSVDHSILLWDLDEGCPSTIINAFPEKVQCVQWHKLEAQTLLAGGCDKTVRVFDCRSPENHQIWPICGEAERICWSPLQPYVFFAASSTGQVQSFDCRKGELWTLQAHEQEVTGIVVSGQCPGLLVTTSADGALKVWDFKDDTQPILIHEKDFKMGTVHCLELSPNSPFIIAAGGDKKSNNFSVLDLCTNDVVKHTFGSRPLMQLEAETTI